MAEYYCQKRCFVNNSSFSFFDYCQKRCFVNNKNSEITHWSFWKLLELNCNLLNYTGKYEYENEYDDEYDLKKW